MRPEDLLSEVPLLQGLDADSRDRIARRLTERRLEPGEYLFREGDAGAVMYLVAEGQIEVLVGRGGRETTLARLGPRSHLGEMAVLDDAPRSTSARAALPTRLVEVPRDVFLDDVLASREARRAVLGEMARRLREADAMVGDHLARDAVQEIEESLTFGERLADRFAALNGSWLSIGGVLAATLAWVAWNGGAARPFDPYPFVLFNLVLAVAVALQGPLLMMSQNRQARRDRAQAAADFRVNLKNELGIQALVQAVGRLERKVDGLRTGREG
jgi:uncharacterized membrane protein